MPATEHSESGFIQLTETARAASVSAEPAHDFSHVLRVTENARRICAGEQLSPQVRDVAIHAALLHELFNYPKDHPQSHLSGDVCAEHALQALQKLDYPESFAGEVTACIRDHSFSKGVTPGSMAARVLQDADRLDAIGAVGVARWAATCASMGTPFYHPADPFCREHEPNDKQFGLDHFYRKLLRIEQGLHTATARTIAAERVDYMQGFLRQLESELPA